MRVLQWLWDSVSYQSTGWDGEKEGKGRKVLVTQSYPTLYNPMDCSLPISSVHGILQARILEWVPISSPLDLPDPRIESASHIAGRFFTVRATREASNRGRGRKKGKRKKRGWIRKMCWGFPWGPVVRTLHFHSQGLGLDPWSGN